MEWLSARNNIDAGNTRGISADTAKQLVSPNLKDTENKQKLKTGSNEDSLVEFDFDISIDEEENQTDAISQMLIKPDAIKASETKDDTEGIQTPEGDADTNKIPVVNTIENDAPTQPESMPDIKPEILDTDVSVKDDIKTEADKEADKTPVDTGNSAEETAESFKGIITDSSKIREYFDSLTIAQKQAILKEVGSLDLINSLNVLDNGTAEFAAKDGSKVTMHSTGECIKEAPAQTTAPTHSETTQDTSIKNDAPTSSDSSTQNTGIQSSTQTNLPASQTPQSPTTSGTNNATLNQSPSNNNSQTGNSTVQAGSASKGKILVSSFQSGVQTDSSTQNSLNSANSELKDLQQQQDAAKTDLEKQQTTYDSTQNDMQTDGAQVEGEISQGETDKTTADNELDSANEELSGAQNAADEASGQMTTAQDYAQQADQILNEAIARMQNAQGTSDNAASNNAQHINEENQAQNEANAAQQEANKAAEKTDTAKSKKEGTKAAANTASAKAAASFNIKNQYQKEVESAQREYNSAQAEQNEDKGLIGKAVDAVKGFLSKLADAVSNAVDKLRGAEKQYEEDKADEEKKWALDEEAQVQLEEKQKEQDKASEISKQAQIILDRKTGEREVSDQEYADALLDLADAVMEQDEASGEYDSALEAVLEANENWQVQNGKITNANGKVVSCTEVCKELEKFVTDKIKEKSDTEASYDKVLKTTAGAIKGDKDKINSLGKQIKALEKDIKEQEKKIALQEQMAAQITAEKSTLDAKKDSEGIGDSIKRLFGFGNAKDKKSFDTKQEALQEAISTGTAKNISKAYKAIYGEDAVVDENGEPKLNKNGEPIKISDLSDKEFEEYIETETNKTINAAKRIEKLDSGEFTYNGQILKMDDIHTALDKQAKELVEEMENALDNQGIVSKFASAANTLFGFGTSEKEAKAQVQQYKDMLDRLKNCDDSSEYASLYKAITGNDFSRAEIAKAIVYNEESGEKEYKKQKAKKDKTDLSTNINIVKDALKEAGGDKELLSTAQNSKAQEAIYDYQNTQKTATDVAIGIGNAAVVTAAVALAPVTGGGSLAVAAGVGAGSNLLLNFGNSIYDGNDDGNIDINYSLGEGIKDATTGVFEGGLYLAGGTAARALNAKFTGTAVATATKATFWQTLKSKGIKAALKQTEEKILTGSAKTAAKAATVSTKTAAAGTTGVMASKPGDDFLNSIANKETAAKAGIVTNDAFNVKVTKDTAEYKQSAINKRKAINQFSNDLNKALNGTKSDNYIINILAAKIKKEKPSIITETKNEKTGKTKAKADKDTVKQYKKYAEKLGYSLASMGIELEDAKKIMKNVDLNDYKKLVKLAEALGDVDDSTNDIQQMQKIIKNVDTGSLKYNKTSKYNLSAEGTCYNGKTKFQLQISKNGKINLKFH